MCLNEVLSVSAQEMLLPLNPNTDCPAQASAHPTPHDTLGLSEHLRKQEEIVEKYAHEFQIFKTLQLARYN